MIKDRRLFVFLLLCIPLMTLSAQTHVSVPVDDPVYHILEQAQLRGLCDPLPSVKPYSRSVVLAAINEMLAAEVEGLRALGGQERVILENAKRRFGNPERGLSLERGAYHYELRTRKKGIPFSGDIGIGVETVFSAGVYPGEGDAFWGTDDWGSIYTNGDMGEHFSYWFKISGGIFRIPRSVRGEYHTFYKDFSPPSTNTSGNEDAVIIAYSQPLSWFPYDYQRKWDGNNIFGSEGITAGGQLGWPDDVSIGSSILSEMSGEFFGDTLRWRFGRIQREWAGMSNGNSLVFNATARPFVSLEAIFNPVPWFSFSALTGGLEFFDWKSGAAESFQNFFSIGQLELNYKNYVHFDIGSTAVWPKRFELGYIFPVTSNFMYQNNIGDYDNMALFGNIKVQYPGIAALWISGFIDEIEVSSAKRLFELDRQMFAFQAGISGVIPFLPFAQVVLSYTKIEPYTYTHTRLFTPWNGDSLMEISYVNNGAPIGYYLPPNSDEIKLCFELLPVPGTQAHFQYQMIRHGADYGNGAVDGSSFQSELASQGRSELKELRKYFLKDGAYEWIHIIKVGGEYTFGKLKLPFTVFGEAGIVFSYFTNINGGEANDGSPHGYSIIDTAEYPKSTTFIATLGFRLFL